PPVPCLPGSQRFSKAIPMRTPQMLWNDDVQAPPNYFVPRITKNVGRCVVPDLNHSFAVREDDGIRSLANNQPENFKAIIATRQAHGYPAFAPGPDHAALWRRRPRRPKGPCWKRFQSDGDWRR